MIRARNINRVSIGVVACILLLCGAYYFVFLSIRKMNEHASTLENEVSAEDNKQTYLASVDKMIRDLNTDISEMDKSIVKSDEDVQFIEYVESTAKDTELDISIDSLSIDTSTNVDSEGLAIFKIHAKTMGSWKDTYRFLTEIESSQFKIKINKISLAQMGDAVVDVKKGQVGSARWEGAFEIYVLIYKK